MAQILQTTLIDNRAVAAAGESFQVDLSVNPLSVILITMRALNTAAAVANRTLLDDFSNKYTSISVRYRGATIIEGDAADLAILMAMRERWYYAHGQENNTDNDVRSLTIPIMLGRRAYDPEECFPATRRGDLILEIESAADAGSLDNHSIHVETIELLDATPKQFIKVTRTQQAMAAAGPNTIDLPIGNKLLGILLRPNTFPNGAARTSSFGEISLEVDNVEVMYSGIDWEGAHALLARRVPPWYTWLDHVHGYVDAAAGQTNTQRGQADFAIAQRYGLIELDPHNDGNFALNTQGAADISLQIISDVADGAALSTIYPIELVETGTGVQAS